MCNCYNAPEMYELNYFGISGTRFGEQRPRLILTKGQD